MNEYVKPNFQTRPYKPSETIRCKDRYQQLIWLLHNIYPLDIYESQGDLIMIFPKNAKTKELYKKWRNKEFTQVKSEKVGG